MTPTRTTTKKRTIAAANLPDFCDFDCPHAAFPPNDAVGACRREQAVYCKVLKRFNNRHNTCIAKKDPPLPERLQGTA